MPVIDPDCFTRSHLQQMREATGAQDILMLERCVVALELVGRLKQQGLDFIFKGGTSLLLQLPEPKRLSIDVDILCQEAARLPEVLDKVVQEAPFTGWTHQKHRDRDEPPTRHYSVSFNSEAGQKNVDWKVLIDVIESENPYANLVEKEVNTSFIEPVEAVTLPVPSLPSLLADKLAAFAPGTIGYPYQPLNRQNEPGEQRPANVVKHLHDLSQLAPLADNLEDAIRSYRRIHTEQCRWRDDYSINECLDDSQAAAITASRVDALGQTAADPDIEFFRRGINSVASHMFTARFGREALRIAGGRAALVAEVIRRGQTDYPLAAVLTEEPDTDTLKNARLGGDWAVIERLKKTSINAYALWEKAQRLRGG